MKKWILIILAVVVVVAGIYHWSRPKPVMVATAEVETGDVQSAVANTRAGTVKACRRAKLAPTIGGQISMLPVSEGDQVETGQILLKLWNNDLVAEVKLREREADASGARADEACEIFATAKREATRLTRLHSQGLASEKAADRAVGESKATKAGCQAARTSTSVAEAGIEVAMAALERTILRAPFAGTIAEVNGELGEVVTPSPVGIPTLPAVDLIDHSCLYISAPIDEVDAPAIRVGMPTRITLDAFGDQNFQGTVRRIAPYVLDIEKQARTVEIEAEIELPDGVRVLLPGYSADVEVILAIRNDTMRILSQALINESQVYVVGTGGVLELRNVEVGVRNWQYTEILDGLSNGETIVLTAERQGVTEGALVASENRR